jgi:hypothetical protein
MVHEPRFVLTQYARQGATADAVMRSLVGHRGWLVPAGMTVSDRADGGVVVPRSVVFGNEAKLPHDAIWAFTDEEAARAAVAQGGALGAYAADMPGARVFSRIDRRLDRIAVNPGSPRELTWLVPNETFPLAEAWVAAVELEAVLAARPGEEALVAPLRAFSAYLALVTADGAIFKRTIRIPTPGDSDIPATLAVAFTAPDHVTAFLATMQPEERTRCQRVALPGTLLFGQLAGFGVSGLLLNPGTPAEHRLSIGACVRVSRG